MYVCMYVCMFVCEFATDKLGSLTAHRTYDTYSESADPGTALILIHDSVALDVRSEAQMLTKRNRKIV